MAVAGFLVAALLAGLLTLFDLDVTFYVPAKTQKKLQLWTWWWGFIVVNGLLAGGLDVALAGVPPFKGLNWLAAALLIGLGYLAVLRLQFSSFTVGNKQVPFGIEAFYDQAKQFVFRRINRIAREARRVETLAYANSQTLEQLGTEAWLAIEQDALLTPEGKAESTKWLLDVLNDNSSEQQKKAALANSIKAGHRRG